jgi:hypothetical protein
LCSLRREFFEESPLSTIYISTEIQIIKMETRRRSQGRGAEISNTTNSGPIVVIADPGRILPSSPARQRQENTLQQDMMGEYSAAVCFFVILSECWFWREIWDPLRGKPLWAFDFCFFGPFSIRMVTQKQSSERHQNRKKGPILVECIMLLFCSRMPILTEYRSFFWGYEVNCFVSWICNMIQIFWRMESTPTFQHTTTWCSNESGHQRITELAIFPVRLKVSDVFVSLWQHKYLPKFNLFPVIIFQSLKVSL